MIRNAAVAPEVQPYEAIARSTFAASGDAGSIEKLYAPPIFGNCLPGFDRHDLAKYQTEGAFLGRKVAVLGLRAVWDGSIRRGVAMRERGCVAPDDRCLSTILKQLS